MPPSHAPRRSRATATGAALLLAFSCILLAPRPAVADGFSGQRLVPAAGAAGGFMVERPVVPRDLGFGAGLLFNYSLNPVVLRDTGRDTVVRRPLEHAMTIDMLGSIGLFDFLELAVHLPIHGLYVGDATTVDGQGLSAGAGLGDLRLVPKVAWWVWGVPEVNLHLGLDAALTFPTGDEAALRGAGGFALQPRLLAAVGAARWEVTLNLGFATRLSEMELDLTGPYELTYGVAGTFGLLTGDYPLDLQAELLGGYQPDALGVAAPLELLGGAIFWPHPTLSVFAAAGPGLSHGLGSPDVRVLAGIRYHHRVPGRDRHSDSDGDGVADYRDDCRDIPEDLDGYQDEDGCPELDNDDDGIIDNLDECPTQAEEPGGDGDGCPDKARVVIRKGQVVIFGKILFKTDSAEPLPKSHALLDQIASVFREHPEVGHINIEGHTDSQGTAAVNQRLSQQRAEAVKKALVERGVDGDMLSTRGYGSTRPVAPNDTPAGRARNRRVEFVAERKQ